MTNKNIHELLQKRVTRRQFLSYIGMSILAVMGVSNVLKSLGDSYEKRPTHVSLGYSSGPYGR